MSTTTAFQKHVVLTRAQYAARKAAGTLVSGTIYEISDAVAVLLITGTTDPTTATACEKVGDNYINTTTGKEWKCTAISDSTYTWEKVIGSTDYATSDVGGAIRVNPSLGLAIYPSGTQAGQVYVVRATDSEVTAKNNAIRPIVPSTIELAIKAGLGSYAGTAFTEAEQTTARNTIGAVALEEYDSTATPAANTLYWVAEDD